MEVKKYKQDPLVSFLVALITLFIALIVANIQTIASLELDFLDYRFKLRGAQDLSASPIVILAIDDQSDQSTPERWPWPREYFAHVIENLNEAGVKAIGVDVILEQADTHGPDSDDKLARALDKYKNVVLAGKISFVKGKYESMVRTPPNDKFTATGVAWGLVSTEVDQDGIYRRYLAGQEVDDTTFSSFAIEVLKIYKDIPRQESLQIGEDDLSIGEYIIPKFGSNSFIINYYGPAGSFRYYSFDNVLDDKDFDTVFEIEYDDTSNTFDTKGDPDLDIPPGLLHTSDLKDKIVLIGSTMKELHDDFPTPFLEITDASGQVFKALTPGVETHANALQTILDGNYLYEIGFGLNLIILLVISALVFLITYRLHTLFGALASLIVAVLYVMITVYVFSSFNLIIDVTSPILVILFSYLGHTSYKYILSQKEKSMIKGAFAHYVPEKVVNQILENPEKLQLGGEQREVTVLFSDAVGFTSISEKLNPQQLVTLLNEYLTVMTDIIIENDGIIDKYEGDAIMAEFGVPIYYENHAYMACKAAIEMQKRLVYMREKWRRERRTLLHARIGINTGEVVVGNMGSDKVFDYTVIGDPVNLGSRLESANKFYNTKIMISEFTYEYVKNDFYCRTLDLIRVKGKEQPIKVFELIEFKDIADKKLPDILQVYEQGIELYRSQSWDESIKCFEQCLKETPDDVPSQIYRTRCIEYKFNSPGPEWDGVHIMKEK